MNQSWTPMLVSVAVVIPALLVVARMTLTVSNRMRKMDADALSMLEKKRLSRAQRKSIREDHRSRWETIVNHRRTTAVAVTIALCIVIAYAAMAVTMVVSNSVISGVLFVLLLSLLAILLWRIWLWSKIEDPLPPEDQEGLTRE